MTNLRAILLASIAGSVFIAPAASAQSDPAEEADLSAAPLQEHETEDNAITVTGTRIARPELEAAMPVSVTRMDEAIRFGQVTAYEALAVNPAMGVGLDGTTACSECHPTANLGISSPNLRNLGANRSLTLIDGQRRVSGTTLSSSVDISMIPVGMIERIEIATGGAAAVYGADAVTGVVNIITKDHVDGLEASAQVGVSEHGDAERFLGSIATGGEFGSGRGSFSIGGSYMHSSPLYLADRYGSETRLNYVPNPANTGIDDGIPDNMLIENWGYIYLGYEPSYYLNEQEYIIQNGVPRPAGYDHLVAGGELSNGAGGDGRNLWDVEQVRGENTAIATMGHYDYDITDDIEYYGYFSYSYQNYQSRAALPRSDSRANTYPAFAYLDSPYLPDAVRDVMLDNDLTSLNIRRAYGNLPFRYTDYDNETLTIGQGLRGPLTSTLDWSAFFQYGRTKVDAIETGNLFVPHWNAARDVIADPVTGQPVCRDEEARAEGCVPFNIFGYETPSQALLDYITDDRDSRRTNTQAIYGANVNGALFALPYGDLSVAVGVEHRSEGMVTTEDPLSDQFYGFFVSVPNLDVSADVTEAYGEIVAPLLSGVRFAERLEVEGAYRFSDYSTVGKTDTWKLGATWSPVRGLTLRGVRSRSVRAPNFGELYVPQTLGGGGTIADPCDFANYHYNPTRAANCRALGILEPLPLNTGEFFYITGGNPDLKPETSDSYTIGAIIQPDILPGFSMTVDYWDIRIKDVITSIGVGEILRLCVDLPSIDNPFCDVIERDPVSKMAVYGSSTQLNASQLQARGIDLGVRYQRRLGPGDLNLSFAGSYLLQNLTETTPGLEEGDLHADGGWQNPHVKATLMASYNIGNFNFSLNSRFHGGGEYDLNAQTDEVYPTNRVPSRIYNDISAQYRFTPNMELSLGVKNVLDVKPPYLPDTYRSTGTYDLVGRYFFMSAKFTL